MLDWLLGVTVCIALLVVVYFIETGESKKPSNEQVAACVLACKGHLTEMSDYVSSDVVNDGNFFCHCKMVFKISKDGSNIQDMQ